MDLQYISPSVAMVLPKIDQCLDTLTQEALKRGLANYTKQLCESDPELADILLEGTKTLPRCIQYVLQQAQQYVATNVEAMLEEEFKQLDQMKVRGAVATMAGSAVPDDQIFQWAKDYYYGGTSVEPKNATKTTATAKSSSKKKADEKSGKPKGGTAKTADKKIGSTSKAKDSGGKSSSAASAGTAKNPNAMDGGMQTTLDGFAAPDQDAADSIKPAA